MGRKLTATEYAIKNTGGFIQPDKLARKLGRYEPGQVALIVMNLQEKFCAAGKYYTLPTPETERVAADIAQLAPQFNKAGVRSYVIQSLMWEDNPFYKFSPSAEDKIFQTQNNVADLGDTAFYSRGSRILGPTGMDKALVEEGRTLLLFAGVFTSWGITQSLLDAKLAPVRREMAYAKQMQAAGPGTPVTPDIPLELYDKKYDTCLLGNLASDGKAQTNPEYTRMVVGGMRYAFGGMPTATVARAEDVLRLMQGKGAGPKR